MGSGINKHELDFSINEVLLDEIKLEELILKTQAGYALLPSNSHLTIAEINLFQFEQKEHRLKELLSSIEQYDYILIDCSPSLNLLVVNALVAADSVLVPVQCEYYALEGLASLLETIEGIRRQANSRLQIDGLLRTLYDARNSLCRQISEELLTHFPNQVYETIIPRNVRLAEAPSHGLPVLLYDADSTGNLAYLNLAKEILAKDGLKPATTNLLKKHSGS